MLKIELPINNSKRKMSTEIKDKTTQHPSLLVAPFNHNLCSKTRGISIRSKKKKLVVEKPIQARKGKNKENQGKKEIASTPITPDYCHRRAILPAPLGLPVSTFLIVLIGPPTLSAPGFVIPPLAVVCPIAPLRIACPP